MVIHGNKQVIAETSSFTLTSPLGHMSVSF